MRELRNRTTGGARPQTGFALVMLLALVTVAGLMLAELPQGPGVCRMELSGDSGRCL